MNHFELSNRVRILVLYNDSIVTAGLLATLATQPDFDVHSGAKADASGGPFDIVLSDYETGTALVLDERRPAGTDAEPPTLILTSVSSEAAVLQAMQRGVKGYVLLGGPLDELLTGIREVAQGRRYLSQAVAHRIVESLGREALTGRETDVLKLLGTGQRNKSIARVLQISVGTVKAHMKAIMAKLNADSRTHAVSLAAQRGLITLAAQGATPGAAAGRNRPAQRIAA